MRFDFGNAGEIILSNQNLVYIIFNTKSRLIGFISPNIESLLYVGPLHLREDFMNAVHIDDRVLVTKGLKKLLRGRLVNGVFRFKIKEKYIFLKLESHPVTEPFLVATLQIHSRREIALLSQLQFKAFQKNTNQLIRSQLIESVHYLVRLNHLIQMDLSINKFKRIGKLMGLQEHKLITHLNEFKKLIRLMKFRK